MKPETLEERIAVARMRPHWDALDTMVAKGVGEYWAWEQHRTGRMERLLALVRQNGSGRARRAHIPH